MKKPTEVGAVHPVHGDHVLVAVEEVFPGEARVALSPEAAKKFASAGVKLLLERGAGLAAIFQDDDYAAVGVELTDRASILARADVLMTVRPPQPADLATLKRDGVI